MSHDDRITNEAIEAIAKILADGYIRYRLKQLAGPVEAPPVEAEAAVPSKPSPRATRKRTRSADSASTAAPPVPPRTPRQPAVAVPDSVRAEIAARLERLAKMTVKELRAEYVVVFGQQPTVSHRQNLFRRIAWEIQAQVEGRLPEEVRQYAFKLAEDTELYRRVSENLKKRQAGEQPAPVPVKAPRKPPGPPARDPRLPVPGSFLILKEGAKLLKVQVLESGFLYDGGTYKTLTAVAERITGKKRNGYLFFGLGDKPKPVA
jgi:hypothetical protein